MNLLKLFKKQIKSNPITISIFILIFYISTLGTSILVSTISSFANNTSEYYSMFDKYTTMASITYNDGQYKHEELLNLVKDIPEDIKFRTSFEIFKIDSRDDRRVVLTEFFKAEETSIYPILEGRYYNSNEVKNKEKVVLLGKEIFEKHNKKVGEKIKIDNENFMIVGVVGYKNKESTFDDTVFMPYTSLTQIAINSFESIPIREIYLSGKDEYRDDIVFDLSKKLNKKNKNANIGNVEKIDRDVSGVSDGIFVYSGQIIIIGICIIFSLLNMLLINYFWVKDRRFEIGVKKAFGIKDRQISLLLILEFLTIVSVASLLAISSQVVLAKIFENIGDYKLEVSLNNFIIIIILNVVISLLVTIIPIKKAIKISPIEIVKGE